MTENEISYLIRGAIFKIHTRFGPGLFENVYKQILKYELEKLGLEVKGGSRRRRKFSRKE